MTIHTDLIPLILPSSPPIVSRPVLHPQGPKKRAAKAALQAKHSQQPAPYQSHQPAPYQSYPP